MTLSYAFTFTSMLPYNPFASLAAESPPSQPVPSSSSSAESRQSHWLTTLAQEDRINATSSVRQPRPRLPKAPRRDISHLELSNPEPLHRKRGWEPSLPSPSTSTTNRRATGTFERLSLHPSDRSNSGEAEALESRGESLILFKCLVDASRSWCGERAFLAYINEPSRPIIPLLSLLSNLLLTLKVH